MAKEFVFLFVTLLYVVQLNGVQLIQNFHGDPCNSNNATGQGCNTQLSLNCVNHICVCNKHFSTFSYGKCVGLSRRPCVQGRCTQGATCIDEKCICDLNHYHNSENKSCTPIKKTFQSFSSRTQDCEKNVDCNDGLVCADRKCSCPLPTYQIFDNTTRSCVTAVGAYCTRQESTCTPNAYCKLLGYEHPKGHCTCLPGFAENGAGSCDATFGRNCSATSKCDSVAELICLNNVCTCRDEKMYQFSQEQRKCLGLVGARCDLGENVTSCVQNALCFREHPKLKGKCKCKEGFHESPVDLTCQKEKELSDSDSDSDSPAHWPMY